MTIEDGFDQEPAGKGPRGRQLGQLLDVGARQDGEGGSGHAGKIETTTQNLRFKMDNVMQAIYSADRGVWPMLFAVSAMALYLVVTSGSRPGVVR